MKKILSILLLLLMLLCFCSCDMEKYATRIDDVNLFINKEYFVENDNDEAEWWKKIPGRNANRFFPEYEEINYDYSDMSFYVYANSGSLRYPMATFVLELVFDDYEKYEEAKTDMYTIYDVLEKPVRHEMPECEYEVGGFLVKILTQGEDDSYPNFVFTICENDSEQIIRYMFLYDSDQDIVRKNEFINGIKKHTNCQW